MQNGDTSGIENQKRDLKIQQLELEIQQRKIADMEKQIAEGRTMTAPFTGVITAIHASEGATASRGQPVVEIADDTFGYCFDFTANSADASALKVGETVSVWLEETPRRSVDGVISEIENASDDGSMKRITIEISGPDLQPGIKASVSISRLSEALGLKIPKSAIRSDNNGYYVLTVTEEEGPLGSEYYVRNTYVTIKDENEETAVVDGLMPNDLIVTEASEPVADGDRVRY